VSTPVAARSAAALAVGSGLLVFVAFPGVGWWVVGFGALAPLLVALDGQAPRRALWLGWTSGFVACALGFDWLVPAIAEHGGTGRVVAVLGLLALAAYQGLRFGVVAWLSARARTGGFSPSFAFALAFVGTEASFPEIFPWSLAGIVHDQTALLQGAELFGPSAVSAVIVCANLALAEPWLARRSRRPLRGRAAAALGLVLPLAAALGALRVRALEARVRAAPHGTIALVQGNQPAAPREAPLARQTALARAIRYSTPPEVVIFSEASSSHVYWEHESAVLADNVFRATGSVPTLFGAILARESVDPPGQPGRARRTFHNSALLVTAFGAHQRYDKQRLLPFAESLPFADALPELGRVLPRAGGFTAGTAAQPLRLGSHELAVFICYEDVIPGIVNRIVRAGDPDLLVNLTNDAWFGDTAEPWVHLALAKMRAVEHRRYLVRATNSGVSAVIDPAGRVVAQAPTFTPHTRIERVAWLRGRTPFEFWGEAPLWMASIASVLLAFVRRSVRNGRITGTNIPRARSVEGVDNFPC
jgi:apolipoprotein N-acyltransferase